MGKRISIVCGAPSSEFMAPFDDPDWELWVLGSRVTNYKGKRVDRIFEVHEDLSHYPDEFARWLTELHIPLVVGEKWPFMQEHVEVFDFAGAREMIGSDYLTSSVAYMMAYAVQSNPDEIALYGVDLAVDDDEYFRQRPCAEAWIGYAKGRGIKITLPDISPVLKSTYIYGKGEGNRAGIDLGVFSSDNFLKLAKEHQGMVEKCEQERDELKMKMNAHAGAQQAYERLAKVARGVAHGNQITNLSDTARIK